MLSRDQIMKDLIRAVKQLGLYYAHYHLFHNEQEETQEVTHRCVLFTGHRKSTCISLDGLP